MLNSLGKFCRKIRIDRNEILYDMAQKLGVSSAFLSKVENGKRKPPKEWRDIIIREYQLSGDDVKELDKCIFEAQNYNNIDISNLDADDKKLMLAFARKFSRMDKEKLKNLLESEDTNE